MKKSYIAFLAAALTLSTAACSKKDDPKTTATTANLSATINGAQQTPPNNSTATGTFTGTYTDNGSTKQLTYTVTYSPGFVPTLAHIHSGAPGVAGKVEIPFANLASPITGTVTLSNEQANALLNNGMYVNMHSSAFKDGEIRGDIKKQ